MLLYAPETLKSWNVAELAVLPDAEDESHEYKSSKTPFDALKAKLACAASAFLNSGGGLFVAGVNNAGRVDGGIRTVVNREPLRDWVDRIVASVAPRAEYVVAVVNIESDNCVLLVAFEESHLAPHMAPDGRYYVRAGAHTERASAFVVEALFARRGLAKPLLRHALSYKPGARGFVQLGLVCASTAPALDVCLELPPSNLLLSDRPKLLTVGVIGPATPLFIDMQEPMIGDEPEPPMTLTVKYKDIAGRTYEQTMVVDVASQLPIGLGGDNVGEGLSRQLTQIENTIRGVGASIGNQLKAQDQLVRSFLRR